MSGFLVTLQLENQEADKALLTALCGRLNILGPDGLSTKTVGPVGLGHARFIICAEEEKDIQPASLDGQTWLVGSIRLDDRRTLAGKLGLESDHTGALPLDSSLVLHAYQRWGETCSDHLAGDFAFAIWDNAQNQLYCARDHFGMRQLYHARAGNVLLISNHLQCLLQHPEIGHKPNPQAMGDFLMLGKHQWLDKTATAFCGVFHLPAGHMLCVRNSKPRIGCYWSLPEETPLLSYKTEQDYFDHFREVFRLAVGDRLRASSAVISLSGGLDSSCLAAMACELKSQGATSAEISSVTGVYDRLIPDEERHYTNLVLNHLGLQGRILATDDYPILAPPVATSYPMELFTPQAWLDRHKLASQLGKVLLTGYSADNVLWYSSMLRRPTEVSPLESLRQYWRMWRLYGQAPPLRLGLRSKLRGWLKLTRSDHFAGYPDYLNPDFEVEYHLRERWLDWINLKPRVTNSRHPQAVKWLELPDWNVDDQLLRPEFTPAQHRDPYMDLRLVNFILSIPSHPWLFSKHILRGAFSEALPQAIIQRPKTLLGDVYSAMLKEPQNYWISSWRPSGVLGEFVDSGKMQPITLQREVKGFGYQQLRPLILEKWLLSISPEPNAYTSNPS
jgi:asparagine synthase (glutamine-hydrolysing)